MERVIRNILLICLCACVCACGSGASNPKYDNPAQCQLDSIITHYHNASAIEFNELALDELFVQYHNELKGLFDTKPIQGWNAKLQALKSSDIDVNGVMYKHTTFDLINGVDCTPKITFNASYYVKLDSLQSDSVYQKLKSIANLQDVKFSGNIRKGADGSVLPIYESLGTSYLMTYPTFDVTITNISQQ